MRSFNLTVSEVFKRSMGWVHTWLGLIFGSLLFAIFWMGTLSVFDKEIDQWMKPEMRLPFIQSRPSIDAQLEKLEHDIEQNSPIVVRLPKPRIPVLQIAYINRAGTVEDLVINPIEQSVLQPTNTLAASGFFFPFHYALNLKWRSVGIWIVGLATMAMLILLVSGTLIHRKLIVDFFTFRRRRSQRRSVLDLHNLAGTIGLPFYFILALTGLIILFDSYLHWSATLLFDGDSSALNEQLIGFPKVQVSGNSLVQTASVDKMVAQAESTWNRRSRERQFADLVMISIQGDANSLVDVRQIFPSRNVIRHRTALIFDRSTGALVHDYSCQPLACAYGWLIGSHFIQFDHQTLRWLYFVGGLLGCVMIATGSLFWIVSRLKKRSEDSEINGVVRAMTVSSITGIILATCSFLIANRLLSKEASFWIFDRAVLEVLSFFFAWVVSYFHAAIRGPKAWSDQTSAIACLAFITPVLNWVTTGDTMLKTLSTPHLYNIAGVDVCLLIGAAIAAWAAYILNGKFNIGLSEPVTTQH